MRPSDDGYRARLLGAQGLEEAEVSELRAGRMTATADRAIVAGIARTRLFALIGALVALLGVGADVLAARLDPRHAVALGPIPLSAGLVVLVVGLLVLGTSLRHAASLRADRKDAVLSIEGPLDAWIPGLDGSTPKRQIAIASETFSSNNDPLLLVVYDHLIDKRRHRVFITKRRRLILAIEPS